MAARIIELADAVAAEINTATFTPSIQAVRKVFVRDELETSSSILCEVTPNGSQVDEGTRGAAEKRFLVDVTLRRKVVGDLEAQGAVLLRLAEEIEDLLARKRLADMGFVEFESASGVREVYDRDDVIQYRMFFVQIGLTYLEYA